MGHHFISYSSVDAKDFALKLCDELQSGPPIFSAWLDKRELEPGPDWDEQIADAIRACDSLLFVMTPDSVERQSMCKLEWMRALKYKKPIVPLLLHRDAEAPFRLASRQHVDFTGAFEPALAHRTIISRSRNPHPSTPAPLRGDSARPLREAPLRTLS